MNPTSKKTLQLNSEGLKRSKYKELQQLCTRQSLSVILIQQTHMKTEDDMKISRYSVGDEVYHAYHGRAILVQKKSISKTRIKVSSY